MAEILATWLNEEVGLTRVSAPALRLSMPFCACRKSKTLRRTSPVGTSSANYSGSSISKQTLKNSPRSKFIKWCAPLRFQNNRYNF